MDKELAATPVKSGITIFPGLRLRLSNDIAELKKKSSAWFALALAGLQLAGPAIRDWWTSMPPEVKSIVPDNLQHAIGYAILFLTLLALRAVVVEKKDATQ